MTNAAPGWYPDPTQPATQRYWDGTAWTEQRAPLAPPRPTNGMAIAALILGCIGLFLIPIPFFIGLLLGGPPAVLAIILGIISLNRAHAAGRGAAPATIGLILGCLTVLLIFTGAGTIW
ncbi:DUF2510 domain-containing protein [Rathayibacter sp. Leaf299]|uniref:DUF2510 domain-containing protein n=1 Tax=Rathayibacter sp. Leaf299 TaxID=1736328 RepID=UPI0009EBD33D|nr:DUF2510 domain-containing protein [Rathayibacter sp. Leaf299]